MTKKINVLLSFLCMFCFIAPAMVQAENQTLLSTIRQPFGGSQSADDARIIATVKARQEALEKAAAYIKDLNIVKQQGFSKDKITALAAGVFETDIVSQKNYVADDGFIFEATARIKTNTTTLDAAVAKLLKNKDLLKKYGHIKKREAELLSRIDVLEAENQKMKAAPSEKEAALKQLFQDTTSALSAVTWYNKALDLANHQVFTDDIAEKAIRYLQTAINLDPGYTAALLWLGNIYSDKAEYGLAVDCYQKVVDIDRKTLGANHPDMAIAYNRLGLALHRNGQYNQAIEAYLAAWKTQIQALGENHPDVATTYNNIGESCRQQGDYDRAIDYYKKDLEISFKTLGRNHPNVATSYNNLAYAYHDKGDVDRAIEYFQKALEVYRTTLGENHRQTETIKENIDFLKTGIQ